VAAMPTDALGVSRHRCCASLSRVFLYR
jgi:hypothetical protein